MNEPDLTGLEADLQKLKPAELPPAFMDRLVMSAQNAARPGRAQSANSPTGLTGLTRPTLLELCWPVLRWLVPAAAAGLVLLLVNRPASPPPAPAAAQASPAPMKADAVQLARKFIGAFDAVAELPGGETVRFRCNEWADQMTLRNADRGIEVVQRTPSFEVIPVRFETY